MSMDWFLQSSPALFGLTAALITMGFLVHMSFRRRPYARLAFMTGLMKGAALEDENPNDSSTNPMVHSQSTPTLLTLFDCRSRPSPDHARIHPCQH